MGDVMDTLMVSYLENKLGLKWVAERVDLTVNLMAM